MFVLLGVVIFICSLIVAGNFYHMVSLMALSCLFFCVDGIYQIASYLKNIIENKNDKK